MKLRAWVLFLASISFRNALGVRQRTPKAKIACVGDSLTAGYPFDSGRGPDASVSGYPYHLQELLADEGYEVRNFGKGETTVVSGSKSYRSGWYNETWQEALRWKPDRVLLMFGANDVKESRLKKFENEFEDAFTQLIQSFLDLDPPPVLALLIPPPMYDNNIYGPEFDPPGRAGGMQQKVYNQQLPLKLQELAERMQVSLIDLHECFLKHESCTDVAVNCCDWEAPKPPKRRARPHAAVQQCAAHDDAIHPNDEGYRNIALMVSDFAMHSGLGLLIGVPLAAMLVPPAIEAGDVMASQILAWRSETDMETSEAFQLLFDNIFPMEFGAKQDWQSEAKFKMRKRMRDFLRLRWLSLTVLLLLLGLLIIYCVASLQGSSVYTAETPRLFQVGHRLYDKARVSGLFDPLEDYQAPMRDALQEARRCSPTASTSAQCTWFKCDAGSTTLPC
ncbi:Acetylxylan esterase [Durusdinium trenchii]|uniref:Acetylxylan esterase n=1 Tax=Durusdinium trenchii TaxID=1381693 RepID=A0ABP0Q5P4_9DINO